MLQPKRSRANRSIYPFSEYKTVRILHENSALCELLDFEPEEITKDKLYRSSLRLYELHQELENWLSNQVRTLFGIENKILLEYKKGITPGIAGFYSFF
jgi:hypothetical protein